MKKKDKKDERRFPIVGIGASAGGLEALQELFSALPPDLEMAFIVVQHSDPTHETLLPSILGRRTSLRVETPKDGERPQPGTVYIPASNSLLAISQQRFQLTPRPVTRELSLPIDRLLRSLASEFEECAVAVILSGGGSDGALGLHEIKAKGGITFAQDEESARFYSMPHNAIFTGRVDFVLRPREIAESLQRIARHEYISHQSKTPSLVPLETGSDDFKAVLSLIQRATGIDYKQYKYPTVSRRILRRMALRNANSLSDYLKYLRDTPTEVTALGQDILIQVTKFFRDPEVFAALKEKVFPRILANRPKEEAIRAWVPGCSSGEEIYSLLICLTEFLEDGGHRKSVQAFGSDVSEAAVTRARIGSYLDNIALDVSPERLRRFFTKFADGYEINKTLRDLCIFAKHNIATDPPFGRLDLITCRNVLIYLEPALQKKVLSVFHYALKPDGILLLGNAETADADLYDPLDQRYRIYVKKAVGSRLYFDYVGTQHAADRVSAAPVTPHLVDDVSKGLQIQREADRILLNEFVPPGVIVDDNLEVMQFRGRTGPYFEHSPGFASLDLLKMLREGLVADVRNAIEAARSTGERERKEGIFIRVEGETKKIAIDVIPVPTPPPGIRFFLLLFEDMDAPEFEIRRRVRLSKLANRFPEEDSAELSQLRAELNSTREYLQSVNEEKEAANEELKAANEEIMSSNEELQSMNEELHTSKEELQSTNEELTTVNDELRLRNIELSQANDDLSNLFNSMNSAVILLTKDLRVRKFTPVAGKLLRLIPADVGRAITDLRPTVEIKNFGEMLQEVLSQVAPCEMEVEDRDGKWYSLHIRPYRTADDRIDGLVLLFSDVTSLKTSLIYAEAVESTVAQPLLVLAGDLKVKHANRTFYDTFRTSPGDTEGKLLYHLANGQWDVAELRKGLTETLSANAELRDFKVRYRFADGVEQTMLLNARRLFFQNKSTETILLAIRVDR